MPAGDDPVPAHGDGDQVIQVEGDDGGSTTGSMPDDEGSILTPEKVPLPLLLAWIEQVYSSPGQWVATVSLVAFE